MEWALERFNLKLHKRVPWDAYKPNICIFGSVKAYVSKIIAVSMALLLLATTTSWKVEKHFCMGHLVDMAFFVDAEGCGMDSPDASDPETIIGKKSCCADEIIAKKGQNDIKPSDTDIDLERQLYFITYIDSCLGLFEPIHGHNIVNRQYIPPKIVKDIQLLGDVFLI